MYVRFYYYRGFEIDAQAAESDGRLHFSNFVRCEGVVRIRWGDSVLRLDASSLEDIGGKPFASEHDAVLHDCRVAEQRNLHLTAREREKNLMDLIC
ncbi:hypothetical protein [Paraburkholderia heleia]|uniref:hypothetical protein n=1 Tax=Paraburkholderia heleia TaxID=634127 RepID=UPI002AB632CE|nr:hypothetical protein [Paraburkholderia heleia]